MKNAMTRMLTTLFFILSLVNLAEAGIIQTFVNSSNEIELIWRFKEGDTQGRVYHSLFPGTINWREVPTRIPLPNGMSPREIKIDTEVRIVGKNGDLNYLWPRNTVNVPVQPIAEIKKEPTFTVAQSEKKSSDGVLEKNFLDRIDRSQSEIFQLKEANKEIGNRLDVALSSNEILSREIARLNQDIDEMKQITARKNATGIWIPGNKLFGWILITLLIYIFLFGLLIFYGKRVANERKYLRVEKKRFREEERFHEKQMELNGRKVERL